MFITEIVNIISALLNHKVGFDFKVHRIILVSIFTIHNHNKFFYVLLDGSH